MIKLVSFLLLLLGSHVFAAPKILLSENKIGDMVIKQGMNISLYSIRNAIKGPYRIRHEIRDGMDWSSHQFVVETWKGEELFAFISLIKDPQNYESAVVRLDEIVIYSEEIQDQYGIYPSMPISEAAKIRPDMEFGSGHMDNYLGSGKIWYMLNIDWVKIDQSKGLSSKEYAIKSDTKINVITWPNFIVR
jgi:hypothetical protein